MKRIVVGVDASPPSVEALRRAADETRWRDDGKLEVVYVFAPPEPTAAFPVVPDRGADTIDLEAERSKAEERLGEWLKEVDVDLADIDVEWAVLADRKPSRALVERSDGAELVVVGSRGRGGFAGLRLGSVSEQVTRHAHCPVLVVRSRSMEATGS
jgi:nucleotide-binding universal stress UspA family protein